MAGNPNSPAGGGAEQQQDSEQLVQESNSVGQPSKYQLEGQVAEHAEPSGIQVRVFHLCLGSEDNMAEEQLDSESKMHQTAYHQAAKVQKELFKGKVAQETKLKSLQLANGALQKELQDMNCAAGKPGDSQTCSAV
ncbi:unnamed protein product [Caretta caretta]